MLLLRGFLGRLGADGHAPASIARKIASVRALFRDARREARRGRQEPRCRASALAQGAATAPDLPQRRRRGRGQRHRAAGRRRRRHPRSRDHSMTLHGSRPPAVSELVGLDLGAIDLGAAPRPGRRQRQQGERVVPLGRKCFDALQAWLARRAELTREPASPSDARSHLRRRGCSKRRIGVRRVQELVRAAGRASRRPLKRASFTLTARFATSSPATPSPRRRRRSSRHSKAPRPREPLDDPALYARLGRPSAQGL